MKDFINERWRSILAFNGLDDFDALWRLEADWFEPPNERRGGWSGVARCELSLPDGGTAAIFLKRQANHQTRTLMHPLCGEPTFLREFRRIMAYRDHDVPSLEPVYFAMRDSGGKVPRAILATEELTGFVSLDEQERHWARDGIPPHRERLDILQAVDGLLRRMHGQHIRHGCFYPKHIFVRVDDATGTIEARVIDLEKSRWRPRFLCATRDLDPLNRYASPLWSRADRMRFLKCYLGIARMDERARRLWRDVAAASAHKNARRA